MGDVDRDGRLDLVVDSYLHYEGYVMRLLLSGSAEPGELFKWVVETYSLSHLAAQSKYFPQSSHSLYRTAFLENQCFCLVSHFVSFHALVT